MTNIPENVENLRIALEAGVDLDLRLYLGFADDPDKTCIAGYGCLFGEQTSAEFKMVNFLILFQPDQLEFHNCFLE